MKIKFILNRSNNVDFPKKFFVTRTSLRTLGASWMIFHFAIFYFLNALQVIISLL